MSFEIIPLYLNLWKKGFGNASLTTKIKQPVDERWTLSQASAALQRMNYQMWILECELPISVNSMQLESKNQIE